MLTVSSRVEITVRTNSDPAALGPMVATMNSCGAAVLVAHYRWDGTATTVRLLTENAPRTTRALETMGLEPKSEPVVLIELPDKPGLVALLGAKLTAAGIDVLYSYTFHSESGRHFAVFRTTDDQRALYLLEVDALIHDVAAALSWHAPVPVEVQAA